MTNATPPRLAEARADFWFVTQVVGCLWRDNRLWAALLGASFVARTALDWLVPTVDFHSRSTMSTFLGVGILLCAGFSAAWRSHSMWTGALAGITTVLIAAIISMVGATWLLLLFHDQGTWAAIQGSGGLAEVFTLPIMLVVPGACLGFIGGVFGCAVGMRARPVS